jgi:hypothetical protein
LTEFCWLNAVDKRARFPDLIQRLLTEARTQADDPTLIWWLQAGGVADMSGGPGQLYALHELARRGQYRTPAEVHCDPIQPVAQTIHAGGDCDQWAVVVMAALHAMGYPFGLFTFGDRMDPYRHVAPGARWGWRWYLLDAKGDQQGLEFDQQALYEKFRIWRG